MKNKKATVHMLLNLISEMKSEEVPANADGSLDVERFKKHPVVKSVITLLKFIQADLRDYPAAYMLFGGDIYDENETGGCVLCSKKYYHFGNNPAPVSDKGRCCDNCNATKVIPARLRAAGVSK